MDKTIYIIVLGIVWMVMFIAAHYLVVVPRSKIKRDEDARR